MLNLRYMLNLISTLTLTFVSEKKVLPLSELFEYDNVSFKWCKASDRFLCLCAARRRHLHLDMYHVPCRKNKTRKPCLTKSREILGNPSLFPERNVEVRADVCSLYFVRPKKTTRDSVQPFSHLKSTHSYCVCNVG